MSAVDVNLISTVGRIRSLNNAQVQSLVDSIAEVGLLNPVTVYRKRITRSGIDVDGYGLIAGAHRLEAVKRLGWPEVPVQIVELDELHRTIAECDENLCGTQLTPAERAEFTHRRKWAYEQLHPETVNGATAERGRLRQVGEVNKINRFTADTATRTGQSERVVQRDAERGDKISEVALSLVKEARHLNTGAYLDKLKSLPVDDQIKKVQTDITAPRPARAQHPAADDDVTERQVAALMSAWNRASREARDEFLTKIGATSRKRGAA
jgi:ParB family chromosome partitioning protein